LKHLSQAALADDTGAALDALLPRAAT
jgi:hypothetical protein